MKTYEQEVHLNPLQAAMFAGDNHSQIDRHEVDETVPEFSAPSDSITWSKAVDKLESEDAASSLLTAVSAYFQLGRAGLGERRQIDDRGQYGFTQVVEGLRRLNRQLADEATVAGKVLSGEVSSKFENTAFCAVNFARAVNIAIPIDCTDLRRWYRAVSERGGVG